MQRYNYRLNDFIYMFSYYAYWSYNTICILVPT